MKNIDKDTLLFIQVEIRKRRSWIPGASFEYHEFKAPRLSNWSPNTYKGVIQNRFGVKNDELRVYFSEWTPFQLRKIQKLWDGIPPEATTE